MKVYYRFSFNNQLSNTGNQRPAQVRPDWFDKWKCLKNFTTVFSEQNITIVADGVTDDIWDKLNSLYPNLDLQRTTFSHGAGTFFHCFDQAIKLASNEIVYFVEDDYVHHEGADLILEQGLSRCAYVSLYDHPDKYWDDNANKMCLLLKTTSCHWRTTPSTTLTFACTVSTLKEDKEIFYRWGTGSDNWVHDTQLFNELSTKRGLITPVPGYSTHCDAWVVDALVDWKDVLDRTTE